MPIHSERASIVMWLRAQEQALSIWIEEILSKAPADADLIERLDEHRRWLAESIASLATARAA